MSSAPPTLVERFAALLHYLVQAVAARFREGGLSPRQIFILAGRLNTIRDRFARLAARVNAGTYKPRRPHTRRPPENPKPRTPNPLPDNAGWLMPLVPAVPQHRASAGSARYALLALFDDPEMQALMAAAPREMGRILRPLCRMLGITPPPALARPRRSVFKPETITAEPAAAASAAPRPAPSPPPDPPTGPAAPAPHDPVAARARGSPHPA